MVLRNRPTLIIGTERLACLNSPLACSGGPSPSTRQVPGSSPGSGGRAARAFFSTLPSFLLPEIFFRTFPTDPAKVLGLTHSRLCFLCQCMTERLILCDIILLTSHNCCAAQDTPENELSSSSWCAGCLSDIQMSCCCYDLGQDVRMLSTIMSKKKY